MTDAVEKQGPKLVSLASGEDTLPLAKLAPPFPVLCMEQMPRLNAEMIERMLQTQASESAAGFSFADRSDQTMCLAVFPKRTVHPIGSIVIVLVSDVFFDFRCNNIFPEQCRCAFGNSRVCNFDSDFVLEI